MSTTGRPRKLDETNLREICALITAGMGIQRAARYVGCSVATIRREAARNPDFDERLRRAEMSCQLTPLGTLRTASQVNWKAAAWYLERCFPEQFGRPRVAGLGKKELRRLANDLLRIVRREIDDPLLLDRIEGQMEATLNYVTAAVWDTDRSGANLKKAMQYFECKDREHRLLEQLDQSRADRLSPVVDPWPTSDP